MAKFNVGDRVVIKDNKNFHRFQNGDVVVITVAHSDSYRGHKVGDDPENWWAFEDSEIEEYKEEVKVQKFNVGDRVRMVRVRKDGLSYSFDKVGNEGTVTDVLSDLIRVDVHCKDNTWEGNGWTYPIGCNCWEVIDEEEKEMPKRKFKVGDLVKGNDPKRYLITNDKMVKAKVLKVYGRNYIRIKILEHLDEDYRNLDSDEFDVDQQYFDLYEEPKSVQNEKPKTTVLKLGNYKIVFNGDTTVVTDGVRKGVAKRHPDDEYDAIVGLQVALERFHGGRKPEVGDEVRVLKVDGNSPYSDHHWEVGDVVTVVDIVYNYDSDKPHIHCFNPKSVYSYQRLIAGEYEVIG